MDESVTNIIWNSDLLRLLPYCDSKTKQYKRTKKNKK